MKGEDVIASPDREGGGAGRTGSVMRQRVGSVLTRRPRVDAATLITMASHVQRRQVQKNKREQQAFSSLSSLTKQKKKGTTSLLQSLESHKTALYCSDQRPNIGADLSGDLTLV